AAQRPQCASVERTTASPSLTAVTPGPTASTIPAPSWPRTTGVGYGIEPSITLRSEWQSPAALIATRTSPTPGSLTRTSSIATGRSGARKTAAFIDASSRQGIPDVEDAARAGGRQPPVLDDRLAVHEHAHDPLGQHLPALLAARHVAHEPL